MIVALLSQDTSSPPDATCLRSDLLAQRHGFLSSSAAAPHTPHPTTRECGSRFHSFVHAICRRRSSTNSPVILRVARAARLPCSAVAVAVAVAVVLVAGDV